MDYPGKVITKNQVTPTQTSATGVWTLDDAAAATRNNNWPVALVPNPISKSLRFNSADSAYLNRTFTTPTNNKIWTWSSWIKLGSKISDGNYRAILEGFTGSPDVYNSIAINSDQIWLNQDNGSGGVLTVYTVAKLRDPSAWYHLVVQVDTTQATGTNRVKMYLNGIEQTLTFAATPSQNLNTWINSANTHRIAQRWSSTTSTTTGFDGYLAEVYFIDGQALTPSSFGMTDPVTGVWEPLKYSGTYGTNGFYLNFKDATSTTTLGYDYSGNANNWTTNNFSVTAGSGNDSLTDVPTPWVAYNTTGDVGGVIRGNYCTLNPLTVSNGTLSNGNLDFAPSGNNSTAWSTFAVNTGKWYWEVTKNSGDMFIGLSQEPKFNGYTTNGTSTGVAAYMYYTSGGTSTNRFTYNSTNYAFPSGFGDDDNGTIYSFTLDFDAATFKVRRNNDAATEASFSMPAALTAAPLHIGYSVTTTWPAGSFTYNFGQRPFAYTPPTGFRSLCTTNLPASTVLKGSEYFNAVTYTGTGSTNSITGVGFQPDLVWLKSRSNANDNNLYDIVRGISGTGSPTLLSNLTDAETTYTGFGVSSLNSDGFTVIGNGGLSNGSGLTYVGWNWKANGAGVTNTAGSITSTVSANTTSGFSIVTFTDPNNSSNYTVGHGLGVTPSMIIQKERGTTGSWLVWHSAATTTVNQYLLLNSTGATGTLTNVWGAAVPTSTVFGLKSGTSVDLGDTVVAYCFAPISGFSAFGKYTGNGSADGPFVYLGFRPRYVLIKSSSNVEEWHVHDTARDTYNLAIADLYPNSSSAEVTTSNQLDILSNGFKCRSSNSGTNGSGYTFIYAAFAEAPFQFANAR